MSFSSLGMGETKLCAEEVKYDLLDCYFLIRRVSFLNVTCVYNVQEKVMKSFYPNTCHCTSIFSAKFLSKTSQFWNPSLHEMVHSCGRGTSFPTLPTLLHRNFVPCCAYIYVKSGCALLTDCFVTGMNDFLEDLQQMGSVLQKPCGRIWKRTGESSE